MAAWVLIFILIVMAIFALSFFVKNPVFSTAVVFIAFAAGYWHDEWERRTSNVWALLGAGVLVLAFLFDVQIKRRAQEQAARERAEEDARRFEAERLTEK